VSAATARLSAEELGRLRSWTVEIAETLLPSGAQRQDRGGDWRFSHAGGLSIAKRSGAWFSHAQSVGGYSTVRLIEHLRQCDYAEAEQWAAAWLASHPGTGTCDGSDDAEASRAAAQANAIDAQRILSAVVSAEGTVGEAYLRSRGSEPPYPDCVRFLPDARIGEGALVGLLTAHNTIVGAQLTYLDPNGRKSLREPVRQTFVLDRERAKGAALIVEKLSANASLLLCEGLEDGLALRASGRPEAVFGLPGIGGLQHFPARRGQAIVVVRDGDAPGSPADKALIKGVDHLLLQGAEVRVTATPADADANSILQADGAAALDALVNGAETATLSRDGEVQRLARLEPADYDPKRKPVADKFGIRLPTLDAMVAAARPRKAKGEDGGAGYGLVEREPNPWPDPVQLGDVLNALRDRLNAHIVFRSRAQSTAVALWIAHSYVFDRFEFTPRLAVESPTPRCGKTTLHDLMKLTVCRAVDADKLTAPSLVRMKSAFGPISMLLDEMGDVLRASPELDGVLRSGFQQGKRYINLRPLPEGGFEHEAHDVFGPVAISLVGAVRGALADRSIHVLLRRKRANQKVAKLRQSNNRQRMLGIGRQLARWARDDGDALNDEPAIPDDLNDRQADFSVPLLAIADQAAGEWPQEARAALVQLLADGADRAEDNAIQLLHDLRTIFDTDLKQRQLLPEKQEIESKHLVGQLLQMAESPWACLANGRPLTQHKLATLLRDFGITPGKIGPEDHRQRGYRRLQFIEAWEAYPEALKPVSPESVRNQSVQSVQNGRNPPVSEDFQSVQEQSAGHFEKAAKTAEIRQAGQSGQFDSGNRSENSPLALSDASASSSEYNPHAKDLSLRKPEGNALEGASGGAAPKANGQDGAIHVGDIIRRLAANHPTWTEERLAKQTGQPIAAVKRALTGGSLERPSHGREVR
jgi:hypothetical protein